MKRPNHSSIYPELFRDIMKMTARNSTYFGRVIWILILSFQKAFHLREQPLFKKKQKCFAIFPDYPNIYINCLWFPCLMLQYCFSSYSGTSFQSLKSSFSLHDNWLDYGCYFSKKLCKIWYFIFELKFTFF